MNEQLEQWRDAFEARLLPATEMTRDVFGNYCLNGLERQWQGYLCAEQETYRELKNLREILEVVQNRFELTKSDRAFLISLKIAKE